jgi:hypothetical protein
MKKITILGVIVIGLSILIIKQLYLSPSVSSECKIQPQGITARVKAGTTRSYTEKLFFDLGLTLIGNPNRKFEPDVTLFPISTRTQGLEYISKLKSKPEVEDVGFTSPENIGNNVYIRFKEGVTREKIVNLLKLLNIPWNKDNDNIDPEIFINAPVGKEDYFVDLLLSNYPQFIEARRFTSCPLGVPSILE